MDEKLSPNRFDLAGVKGGFARGMEEKFLFWLFISDLGVEWKVRIKKRKEAGREEETGQAGMDESEHEAPVGVIRWILCSVSPVRYRVDEPPTRWLQPGLSKL